MQFIAAEFSDVAHASCCQFQGGVTAAAAGMWQRAENKGLLRKEVHGGDYGRLGNQIILYLIKQTAAQVCRRAARRKPDPPAARHGCRRKLDFFLGDSAR